MALEKLFEQIIDHHIRLNTSEEIITDVGEKCMRVHSIRNKTILYFGGVYGDNSHCNSYLNPKILYANIDRFPNLRELLLEDENDHIDLSKLPPALESFSYKGRQNLAALDDLPNLNSLGLMRGDVDLSQFPALATRLRLLSFADTKDESQLANFRNLETLTFGTLYKSCAPIGELKNLRRLQIETFKPDMLAGLEGCEALTNLRIQVDSGLSDISELAQLKFLRQFTAFGMNAVTDLSPLAELPLEVLDIPNCGVTDFSPLSGIKSLKKLNLSNCLIDDLTVLEGLENLEEINLCGAVGISIDNNRFFDPLVNLPNLKQIIVDGWARSMFSPALREKLGLRP